MRVSNFKMKLVFSMVLMFVLPLVSLADWDHVGGVNANANVRPGSASFNGLEYIFFRKTTDGNIGYITTSNVNGGSFSGVTTLSTIANNPEPGAIAFNNKIFVFYAEGSSPNRLFFRHKGTSGGWSSEFVVPGASTNDRPGLAVYSGKLYIFWETAGSNNSIRYATLSTGGAISGVSTIPSAQTYRGPAAEVFNNKLYIVYSEDANPRPQLWYTSMSSSGVWASVQKVGGSPRTSFPPSATTYGGQLHVYYAGANDYKLLRKRLYTNGSWSGEEWVASEANYGGCSSNLFGSKLWLTRTTSTADFPASIAYLVF